MKDLNLLDLCCRSESTRSLQDLNLQVLNLSDSCIRSIRSMDVGSFIRSKHSDRSVFVSLIDDRSVLDLYIYSQWSLLFPLSYRQFLYTDLYMDL